ncbi:MAG: N-acetyl-gamma-glutamyl-phosphate reductase [Spirochaetaceae bacterium]|jgi:N-acetyl-gamma-glutamyl-phosphate reductase|nr:N-acetyl-gamma-glutamyl-phosphate reductase [Spirochaetaceae bacterium]
MLNWVFIPELYSKIPGRERGRRKEWRLWRKERKLELTRTGFFCTTLNMVVGIVGAAGYAGVELVRILSPHPAVDTLALASVSRRGQDIRELYPNFLGPLSRREKFGAGTMESPEETIDRSDIVFGALPAGTGEPYAKACLDRGISYIDLSADFRFDEDQETYTAWYGLSWQYPALHHRSVYGLPELNRDLIKTLAARGPVIIGNPGCFPTVISLAAYPAVCHRAGKAPPCAVQGKGTAPSRGDPPVLAPGSTLIADAVSGVTGAGRELARAYHFPECSDSVSSYKVGVHRHTPEISRNLMKMAGKAVPVVFTPHLGPLNRGILATVYIPLDSPAVPDLSGAGESPGKPSPDGPPKEGRVEKEKALREWYAEFYRDEPFVRILPSGVNAATGRVRQSNFCDISVHLDQSGTMLILESAIDNMVKGAAGQAVQNMNIICGFEETQGLEALPALF